MQPGDLKVFFALHVAMGLVHKPNLKSYWSKDLVTQTPFFGEHMSHLTFELISQKQHFANDSHNPAPRENGHDPLAKVRHIVSTLQQTFRSALAPNRALGLDEATCPFHGVCRFRAFNALTEVDYRKQFLPTKEALHAAIMMGHVDSIAELIAAGANVNAHNAHGATPLLLATSNIVAVRQMLAAGANVNAKTEDGSTALSQALVLCNKGSSSLSQEHSEHQLVLLELLKAGAELNVLRVAQYSSDVEVVTILLAAGVVMPNSGCHAIWRDLRARKGQTDNHTKAEESVQQDCDLLLTHICRESIRHHLRKVHRSWNLFHMVLKLPLPPAVHSFLLYFVGMDERDTTCNERDKALLQYSYKGDVLGIRSTLAEGADVNAANWNGETALLLASQNGHKECVQYLLEIRADKNKGNTMGITPLMAATRISRVDIVELLVNAEADIHAQDKNEWTALHQAACHANNKTCLQTLLQSGADVNSRGRKYGTTALHLATQNGQNSVIGMLVQFGAEVNAQDCGGGTALHIAAKHNDVDCVKELIWAGADLNTKDAAGHTAMDFACAHLKRQSFSALWEAGAVVNISSVYTLIIVSVSKQSDMSGLPMALMIQTAKFTDAVEDRYSKAVHMCVTAGITRSKLQREAVTTAPNLSLLEDFSDFPLPLSVLSRNALAKGEVVYLLVTGQICNSLFHVVLLWFWSFGWPNTTPCSEKIILAGAQDIIPLHTTCPMTTVRNGRTYMATVAKGETTCLQGDKSDVQLQITAGCPRRPHLMEVRTDLSSFASIIPDDECFIAPVVDVLAPAKTETSAYLLRIPHCLNKTDDRNNLKVRMCNDNWPAPNGLVGVPPRDKCSDGILFYDVDETCIKLHTPHFCKVICTICQNPLHCLRRVINFCFAKFEAPTNTSQHFNQVEVRPFFCSQVHEIVDLRQVSW